MIIVKMAVSKQFATPGDLCTKCYRQTKYECIECEAKICNRCSVPERDESVPGWVGGKAVAYCPLCSIEEDDDEVEDELGDYQDQNSDPSLSENEESPRSPTPPPSKVCTHSTPD